MKSVGDLNNEMVEAFKRHSVFAGNYKNPDFVPSLCKLAICLGDVARAYLPCSDAIQALGFATLRLELLEENQRLPSEDMIEGLGKVDWEKALCN